MAQLIHKVGDVVTLPSERPPNWNKKGLMDHYLGRSVIITQIDTNSGRFWFNGSDKWLFVLSELQYKEVEFSLGEEVGLKKVFKIFRVLPNHMFDICDDNGNCITVSETQIYKIIKNENEMKQMKNAVVTVAKSLLKANNTVTTLEIKTELRRDYPYYFWTQDVVSKFMDQLAGDGVVSYKDNGTYRIYSLAKPVATKSAVSTKSLSSKVKSLSSKMKYNKNTVITQSDAIKLASDPNFNSVVINRRNGKVAYSRMDIRIQKKSPFSFINRSFGNIAEINVAGKIYQVK